MARHHFVPQFLLYNWADSGKINSFWWEQAANRVVERLVAVRKACQIEDLNAFYGVSRSKRNTPEDDFFTPLIDTPAHAALVVILSKGIRCLSFEQRQAWARFLVAFPARMPDTLRHRGPIETRKGLKEAHEKAGGPPDFEVQVSQIIENNMPALEKNMPLCIAMELASDLEKIQTVMAMDWWTRSLDRDDILIGDSPLLAMPRTPAPCGIPLNDPNCMIVLPLSPRTLFFASANTSTRSKNRNMTLSKLVCTINKETITRADKYVYSRNATQTSFVKRELAQKKGAI